MHWSQHFETNVFANVQRFQASIASTHNSKPVQFTGRVYIIVIFLQQLQPLHLLALRGACGILASYASDAPTRMTGSS